MDSKANILRVILIIFFLASPAAGIRILSIYSSDPYLQPLALTKEGVAAVEQTRGGDGIAIIDIEVSWGREAAGTLTQERLHNMLVTTLQHQTRLFRIKFNDTPGRKIGVTFVVGPNRFGPLAPSQMIDGLNSALVALRMTNQPRG